MFMIVVAACMVIPQSNIAPEHQLCSLLEKQTYYQTEKECVAHIPELTKLLGADKTLKVGKSMCVDRTKLPDYKPPSNPVDPKLKPLTPEQQSKDFKSL